MDRNVKVFFLVCVALFLMAILVSCRSQVGGSGGGASPSGSSGPDANLSQTDKAVAKKPLGADEVRTVTGIEYKTVEQLADFPNIKHWQYQAGIHLVSLLIASGETARERMKQSKLVNHSAIADFQDEAIWEPIKGQLTARAGERCVEVRLSKSHGAEPQRLEHAKTLAKLMFERL
jgi:hypothetical protein